MNSIQLISAENKLNGTYDKDCDHITFGKLSRLKKGSNPFLYFAWFNIFMNCLA